MVGRTIQIADGGKERFALYGKSSPDYCGFKVASRVCVRQQNPAIDYASAFVNLRPCPKSDSFVLIMRVQNSEARMKKVTAIARLVEVG